MLLKQFLSICPLLGSVLKSQWLLIDSDVTKVVIVKVCAQLLEHFLRPAMLKEFMCHGEVRDFAVCITITLYAFLLTGVVLKCNETNDYLGSHHYISNRKMNLF